MANMQKILEISGEQWTKGLSLQTGLPVGGLFQTATGFDPFEKLGFLQPALSPTELTAPTTNPIKVITPYETGGTGYVYGHSSTKLYRYLRESPFTQTDQTSSINFSAAVAGALVWKTRYIYAQATDLRSWDFSASDVQILNGSNASGLDIRKICIGADKNIYIGDYGSIAKCVLATGTAGNALDTFLIDVGFTVRDILNDGRYLVILADNNNVTTTSRVAGNYACRIYFWDMSKTTADVIWDIQDSYIIGAALLDGIIHVFTYNGISICNIVSPPKQIFSFLGNSTITKRPLNPYCITVGGNTIYWADGATNGQNIYAYGALPGTKNKIFYSPYVTHSSTPYHTSLAYSAGTLFTGTSAPKFFAHNTGSTRGNATLQATPIQMDKPYEFGLAKVTLRSALTSGQAVSLLVSTASGVVISDTETKSYSASNARKNLVFHRTPASGSTSRFEDLSFTLNPQGGAVVERLAIYGTPSEDANQDL